MPLSRRLLVRQFVVLFQIAVYKYSNMNCILFYVLFFDKNKVIFADDLKCKRRRNFQNQQDKRRRGSVRFNKQHQHHNRIRRLQGADECLNLPGSNFTQQILGPSYDVDSLYNNVPFYSTITGLSPSDDDGTIITTLPIYSLTSVLLEEILLYSDVYTFNQQKEYFGRNGEYTQELLYQHQLLIDFWQVNSIGPPILLIGVHSELLQPQDNLEKAVAVLSFINEYQDDVSITNEVRIVASAARYAIETELPEGYSNYDLTANDGFFLAYYGVVGYEDSSVIVLGDGALQFDVSLGHGATGNDIFHAHEFGHALQHILDLEDFNGDYDAYLEYYNQNLSPAVNRYNELEADAMAGYVLAHKLGRDFPLNLLLQTTRSAFAIGDCSYNSDDHHGSPKQRECATKWGADEGLDMTGNPLTPREFRTLFNDNYEMILALDSTVCHLTDDIVDSNENSTTTEIPSLSPITTSTTNTTTTTQPTFPTVNDLFTSTGVYHRTTSFVYWILATTVLLLMTPRMNYT